MKLLLNTETERELACSLPSANEEGVTDSMLEEVGAWMTSKATRSLDFDHAHRQSVGAFVIVQEATPEEEAAWDQAIADCRATADAKLIGLINEAKAAAAE